MCKLNLSKSMALILMAASMSCSIAFNTHAKADEISTAGGSKPLSTSDTQVGKIDRDVRFARRDASLSTAESKNLGVSPERLNSRRGPWPVTAGGSKSNELTTADGSLKIDRNRHGGRHDRRDVGFSTVEMKEMDCDPRLQLIERNRRSTSISAELKSSALEVSKPLSTGEIQDIVIEGELGGAGEPLSKPKPIDILVPYWTRIAPGDTHYMEMELVGWTIFSLQAQEGSVLNVFIYDADWNLLAEFDSTGCGAFLQVDPQSVTVVIQNASKDMPSKYILSVFDVVD
jgi:hypothetical protein